MDEWKQHIPGKVETPTEQSALDRAASLEASWEMRMLELWGICGSGKVVPDGDGERTVYRVTYPPLLRAMRCAHHRQDDPLRTLSIMRRIAHELNRPTDQIFMEMQGDG